MPATDFSNSKDVACVKARLRLITTEDGGRQTAIRTGYRPNHVFEYVEGQIRGTHIGEIQFDDTEEIKPGEEKMVTVYFLAAPYTVPFLKEGQKWWIHEGSRLVGAGEILSIVRPAP